MLIDEGDVEGAEAALSGQSCPVLALSLTAIRAEVADAKYFREREG
jgi:hypothetical protein